MSYRRLGLYRPRGIGRCGLCGQQRQMTEAHFPPRAIGNHGHRERAQWVADVRGARLSEWIAGGLSVYGLCSDCNGLTSGRADPAYVDLHHGVARVRSPATRRLLITRNELPVRVAPGLVARSVIAGMFAINDQLQERFPDLARGLRDDHLDLRLPVELQLRLALTEGQYSRLGGPVGYMRVLGVRELHMPLAEVWFPPLAWCLRSSRSADRSLGPEITSTWGDVTDWIRYVPDMVTDLRNVVGSLPVVNPPRFGADEWVVLSSDEAMTALEGRPKQS